LKKKEGLGPYCKLLNRQVYYNAGKTEYKPREGRTKRSEEERGKGKGKLQPSLKEYATTPAVEELYQSEFVHHQGELRNKLLFAVLN
jgi:hypothetical protein